MNKKFKVMIIMITLIIGIILLNQLKYRNDEIYAVNLKNKIAEDLVSILISDGSNNYTNYEGNTFPSNTEYTLNSELSKCQDNNGNVIEGIFSYDEETGKVNIRTKKTTYCYLYFDKKTSGSFLEELIASGELWQSGLEGDGYRYTGSGNVTSSTSPNNFICFGTNSLSECKANENKYMYRIIGVFPDESGEQHLKLIKYKQLPGTYFWHSDDQTDTSWGNSDLYKGLNGISGGSYNNLFIRNTTYDYLQDNTWLNKIADWKWTATNSDLFNRGPNYESTTTEQMYLHEMNRSSKTNARGEWTYPKAKIGLMYASDYQMSLGSSSLTMTNGNDKATLKTGWLYPGNNESTTDSSWWLITRSGYDGGPIGMAYHRAYYVFSTGAILFDKTSLQASVAPVFYLDSTVTKLDGNGEYDTPYLISAT